MSSKVTYILDEFFGPKTLYIIYFQKPLVKFRSVMLTLVIAQLSHSPSYSPATASAKSQLWADWP